MTLQGENQPLIRNVMTLKSCSPIVGVDVMSFDSEKEVLLAWRVLCLHYIFFLTCKELFFFSLLLCTGMSYKHAKLFSLIGVDVLSWKVKLSK